MTPEMTRILLLGEDGEARQRIAECLTAAGFALDIAPAIERGMAYSLLEECAMVIVRCAQGLSFDQLDPPPLHCGPLSLDETTRMARLGRERLDLTTAEFDLLLVLVRARGRALTRDELAQKALGRPIHPQDRSIDVHISNLRKKLGLPDAHGISIRTVRSVGYLLSADKENLFRPPDESLQTTPLAQTLESVEIH